MNITDISGTTFGVITSVDDPLPARGTTPLPKGPPRDRKIRCDIAFLEIEEAHERATIQATLQKMQMVDRFPSVRTYDKGVVTLGMDSWPISKAAVFDPLCEAAKALGDAPRREFRSGEDFRRDFGPAAFEKEVDKVLNGFSAEA